MYTIFMPTMLMKYRLEKSFIETYATSLEIKNQHSNVTLKSA